jgi:hemerythrin-like domain-containing protein
MQRIAELVALSHDHHSALVLARRCRQSRKTGAEVGVEEAWRQVLEAFPRHLEPHFTIEEKHLLPALEKAGEEALVQRVREDHAALRALVAEPAADPVRVERFGATLEAHVRFEEREVFEVAQRKLAAPALEEVAEACRRLPRLLGPGDAPG